MADITPEDLSALDRPADAFFVALHGAFGEDGGLQSIMDERGLVYCGSDAEGCRRSIDKYLSKKIFEQDGLPTAPSALAEAAGDLAGLAARWTPPVVVKPVTEGSSIGLTIVRDAGELQSVLSETFARYGPVLIEKYLCGMELTVGLLGWEALPIIEIRTDRPFYDYFAKYESNETQYLFDIDIKKDLYVRIQEMSVRAARALGLRDFGRVDWRLDEAGRPFILEVNAIPGFTDHSLLPKAARQAGVPMPELCDRIVRMAMSRRASRPVGCVLGGSGATKGRACGKVLERKGVGGD